jgi:hypothetical protein
MPRTSRITSLFTTLAIVAALGGCAAVATHDEYGAYRAVRRAENDRDRLLAAQRYVERHPGGFWITEVQAERRSHEDQVWEASNATREGLEWYLQVYPDGQYVEQARPRLAALQTVSSRREEEVQRQEQLEQQRRQQAAEAQRTWVTRAVQFWTRTLVGIRNYGASIPRVAAANREFSEAFGQQPQPTCTPEYCIKAYGQRYHIPVRGGTRIDRQIEVFLRLRLDRGRMNRAELILPNKGFSRWFEMENRAPVTDEDPEQRNAALNWVLERIQPIVEAVPGVQRIDYIPEPIVPLEARDAGTTEQAPNAPSGKQDVIDELLGTPQPETPAEPPPEALPEAQGETLVLPIGLLAWQVRNLRVVVFAAAADDYEQGYDGIFVELVQP